MSRHRWRLGYKLTVLEYASELGRVSKACRNLGVPGSSFYRWGKAYAAEGVAGLRNKKPIGKRWPNQLSGEAVEKILHLRRQLWVPKTTSPFSH